VVTDIKMPPNFRLEGIDCAHAIRDLHPGTGVVVLSAHDDEEYALALLGRGDSGLGYLLKDRIAEGDELARAIKQVAAGGSMVDKAIAERLAGRREAAGEDREVLDLMALGMDYEQMADRLDTTQEGVDKRVTELFRKLAGGAGKGESAAVDELKKLHSAVVEREASSRTLRAFIPQGVADRLVADSGAQEEMEATILFSDIRGFSTLAEKVSAREIADLVGEHLTAMAEVVAQSGGMVDKFAGDAVMAVFGVPERTTDHAERALRCALAMQLRQGELNAAAEAAGGTPLQMGVGVNTGMVIAGTIGGGGRLEYTVMGDAVNVAQRLQGEADGGEILTTRATAEAAPSVSCEPIGTRQVKGRSEPVEVFRVNG
jgi:class 3 adenylate cyclase